MKKLLMLFLSLTMLLTTVYADANTYLEKLIGEDITRANVKDIKQPHVDWSFDEEDTAEFLGIIDTAGLTAEASNDGIINTYHISCFNSDRVVRISVYSNGIMEIDGEKYAIKDLATFENGLNKLLSTQSGGYGIQCPSKTRLTEISDWARPIHEKALDYDIVPGSMTIGYLTDSITREQFCDMITLLIKKQNKDKIVSKSIDFKDNDNENVDYLVQRGIIQGKSETSFAPNDFLTREEAATILCRILEYPDVELSADEELYADDEEISDWARDSVYKAKYHGIMIGIDDNKFSSKDLLSKEQAITTVYRIFESYIKMM